jgi:hypothetical protein
LTAYAAEENRCGWFSNPTPGNAWLKDRDGEWTIGTQGNHDTCRNDRRLGKASE